MILNFLYKILYYLPYIGLAVYIVRVIILKTVPSKVPKGKKLTKELLLSCIEQLKKEDKNSHELFAPSPEIIKRLEADLSRRDRLEADLSRRDNLEADHSIQDNLKDLLDEICAHLLLNGDLFTLNIKNSIVSDRAGEIRPGISNIPITLELKEEYDVDTVVSVMAHEVMHQYLFFQGIKRRDPWENEILTDTAVVYAGFYSYMIKGYAPKHGVNPFAYTKVGYISTKDIQFINDNIC